MHLEYRLFRVALQKDGQLRTIIWADGLPHTLGKIACTPMLPYLYSTYSKMIRFYVRDFYELIDDQSKGE